ncbi:hypothetical protein F5Y19DRAFT_487307 [Xylariaceae sp. FL1651]|nr:hypothetical protein F5Y19DRAFT_487307 [Xylariaceae sp. FL1651]
MPVTIDIAPHGAEPVRNGTSLAGLSPEALLLGAAPAKRPEVGAIIQSSFSHDGASIRAIAPRDNGLVRTVFQAYTSHHHLVLRPEDIWFAILTQFSFHVNAHAEALRHKFVAHEGKLGLVLKQEFADLASVDYSAMCINMTRLIEETITDPSLRTWIMPAWSTTTRDDTIVASVCIMGTLQRYFEYVFDPCMCGIPKATLLGDRADWADLAARVERLGEYGDEPALFRDVLRPVVRGFVETFDTPRDERVRDFWSRAVDYQSGSGMNHLSGWITAFLVWDEEGSFRIPERVRTSAVAAAKALGHEKTAPLRLHPLSEPGWGGFRVDLDEVPAGFVSVPVKLKDPATEIIVDTQLLAGSVGMEAVAGADRATRSSAGGSTPVSENENTIKERIDLSSSGHKPPSREEPSCTVRPVTGWWMYEVKEGELAGKNMSLPEFLGSRKGEWTGQVTGTVNQLGSLSVDWDSDL